MGFVLSKVSWLWSPAGYYDPDPATGLTPCQKDLIQNTWKIVRTDTRKNGIRLFLRFFDTYPEYQKLFKGFADVPRDELASNGKLLAHAMSVMYALNSVVDNLYDIECLIQILKKVGVGHQPRNIQAIHFKNLIQVVIDFLKDVLGLITMNEVAEEAWRKALEVITAVIVDSLENKEQ